MTHLAKMMIHGNVPNIHPGDFFENLVKGLAAEVTNVRTG